VNSDNARIGELLDEAIAAVNKGDLKTAHDLAELVLREDASNRDAEDLLAAEASSRGELRRLTILCCDLVGSTELSERHEPERYRTLVRRYQALCRETIEDRYDGHIVSVKGDGMLALFGHPAAHEDDTRRAVKAGFDLCRGMRILSHQAQREVGEAMDVRVGVHRGLVFIDLDEDDVYGLAANLASRVEGLAAPGTVVITDEVRRLVDDRFEVLEGTAQAVKGVSEPVRPFTVIAARAEATDHRYPTPLVGRSAELAALQSAWRAVADGEPVRARSVLIRGEPGIGKSRLAAAIAQEARDQRAVVVELAGSPFHSTAGFYPIQVLLETRCGIDSDTPGPQRLRRLRHELGASGADPNRTVPLLAPILGLAPTVGYEPLAAEGRKLNDEITSAVYEYVVACFGGGPGILLVEDIQWLDESTLALLSRILAGDPGALFIVLTSREAAPLSVSTVVELQPLPREECLQLVDALQPDGLSSADRSTLADRSDGVPLYLEELVRGWGSESVLDREVDAAGGIPDALYEPLVARLLATNGVVVAGAAATVGRDVDRALLEALLDISTVELDRELEALTVGRILVCTGPNREHYRFRHELLRSVAYDLQSPAKRRQVHGRAGDLLVLGAGSDEVVDWTLVATHYERAGRPNEAAGAYEHASDRARQRGALAEARGRLGKSVELITELPDGRERMVREVSVRLRRGFLAMSTEGAGSAQAASDYARCLELAMVDAQGDEMFSSLISLWAYHLSRAELARAREVLETLRTGLEGTREWFRPANRAGFGMLNWFEGDFAAARDVLEAAASDVELGDRDSAVDEVWFVPNDPTASIHTHLALARFMCGDTAGADAAMAHSAATAAPLDFPQGPWSTAYGTWLRSWMLAERGEFDRAAADATDLLELSVRHGFDSWSMIATTQQAAVAIARAVARPHPTGGGAGEHAAVLGGLVAMWQALELLVLLPYYLTVTGAGLAAAGDVDGAQGCYDEALALGDRTGMRFYEAETRRCVAHLATDPAEVAARLLPALELARAQSARPFELRIALDRHDLLGPSAHDELAAAAAGFAPESSSRDLDVARTRLAKSE
jgi:class 3 adenylate cyclase/tetratricopeptide (TPR) repeat protein